MRSTQLFHRTVTVSNILCNIFGVNPRCLCGMSRSRRDKDRILSSARVATWKLERVRYISRIEDLQRSPGQIRAGVLIGLTYFAAVLFWFEYSVSNGFLALLFPAGFYQNRSIRALHLSLSAFWTWDLYRLLAGSSQK